MYREVHREKVLGKLVNQNTRDLDILEVYSADIP
jgi:hypothetical protein